MWEELTYGVQFLEGRFLGLVYKKEDEDERYHIESAGKVSHSFKVGSEEDLRKQAHQPCCFQRVVQDWHNQAKNAGTQQVPEHSKGHANFCYPVSGERDKLGSRLARLTSVHKREYFCGICEWYGPKTRGVEDGEEHDEEGYHSNICFTVHWKLETEAGGKQCQC